MSVVPIGQPGVRWVVVGGMQDLGSWILVLLSPWLCDIGEGMSLLWASFSSSEESRIWKIPSLKHLSALGF